MKQTIRLLISEICNRHCAMCCNQSESHDLDQLPILGVHHVVAAEQVVLTGGEPMINPQLVIQIANQLRQLNPELELCMYTAHARNGAAILLMLEHLDGITLTLHKQADVHYFEKLQSWLDIFPNYYERDLRLNYFSEEVNITGLNTTGWRVQPMEWLKDCPLPDNEVLLRYAPTTDAERYYRRQFNELNKIPTMDPESRPGCLSREAGMDPPGTEREVLSPPAPR